jgi:hypothetical protein
MRRFARVLLLATVALGVLAGPAFAQDRSFRMDQLFTSPNQKINSDFAFWGDHAFSGYYSGDSAPSGGVRIFDISNPAEPELVKDLQCDGLQADPIVWDRNGNGVADLLLLAVDRTMTGPNCGDARSFNPDGSPQHGDPDGWEGVRVFTMSDNPANPFATITQVKAQYTDCGAHTITAWPGELEETGNLLVYVSSYPLRPGPTCGDTEFQNTANPFDEDPGSPANPKHGVIQVLEVPLDNPAATREIAQPEVTYPGDPDQQIDWCERGEGFGFCDPALAEPGAVACHDIVVHVEHRLAGAACAEQGQVWGIDEDGIPDTENPMSIGDDELTGGPNAQFPGAVDFFHSVMFDNEGEVVNWVDESFGAGCPTMTSYLPRPWNPAGGTHKTGKMFFSDMEGNFLSEFHVGDRRPDDSDGEYCSAHMGMAVMGIRRDLLVNAWYSGGVDVIDFTKASRLKEISFYDPESTSATWSAYPYTGPLFRRGGGIPVYASDGVENPPLAQGMVVYRAKGIPKPGRKARVDHLNPQTMDHMMGPGEGKGRGKGKARGRGRSEDRGKGRSGDRGSAPVAAPAPEAAPAPDAGTNPGNGRGNDRSADRGGGRSNDADDDDRGRGHG